MMMKKHRQPQRRLAVKKDAVQYRVSGGKIPRPLRCIDLFAGCGGLSLGLEQAGFHPLLFSEFNKSASETCIANRAIVFSFCLGKTHDFSVATAGHCNVACLNLKTP